MLKIKDNVNLKELEKFGFKECETKYIKWEEDDCIQEAVYIYKEGKEILIYLDDEYYKCCCGNNVLDILFDLIKADLVEKVEE